MGNKIKTYITEPQRIYSDPLHPSDYNEVIPKTTSDAVYIETTGSTLTDYLKDIGGSQIDERNTIISGDDIVKIEDGKLYVGNYVITVSNGFTETGRMQNVIFTSNEYTEIPNPTVDDRFLVITYEGVIEYCKSFDGGRYFPDSPSTDDIFFNNQLRKAFKFDGSKWNEYPCTPIASFSNGLLTKILPYNTDWWNEVVWENTEPDVPCGMNLSVFTDTDGKDYLRINKGGVIDNRHYFTLESNVYKDVTKDFEDGDYSGSGDGNYSSTPTNIVPNDITISNLQGFSVTATNNFEGVFNCLNPDISEIIKGWETSDYPASFTIGFPNKKSINKYTITGWYTEDIDMMAKSWDLLGSNDGDTWELIHSVNNSIFSFLGETREFSTTNTKEFNTIKFVVRGNTSGITQSCCLGQIRFYSSIPKLGVFAITDDKGKTDILTSPNSGPTLPDDYVYYHRIGTVSVDADGKIVDLFPKTTMGIDIASNYAYIQNKVDNKLDSNLKNIGKSSALLVNLVAPRTNSGYADTTIITNTVYKADVAGYVYAYAPNATTIHNSSSYESVYNLNTLVASAQPNNICSSFISAGSFYMVTGVTGAGSFAKFIPAIGSSL